MLGTLVVGVINNRKIEGNLHISWQEQCVKKVLPENVGIFGRSFDFQANVHHEGMVRLPWKCHFMVFVFNSLSQNRNRIIFHQAVPWENCLLILNPLFEAPFPESLAVKGLSCGPHVIFFSSRRVNVMLDNYRPVSLLSVVSKIMQRCTYNHVYPVLKSSWAV